MAPFLTADTSLVIPSIIGWHSAHERALAALADVQSLPAHVLAESYSVLTRLPGGLKLPPTDAELALRRGFPEPPLVQGADDLLRMLRRLAEAGIGGGRVYDGVVAATTKAAGAVLLTADRRAVPIYASLGVDFELIDTSASG